MKRESIEVDLSCEDALALVAASFERAKTAPTRTWDGGWAIERKADRLLVRPRNSRDYLLDPLPETYTPGLPETLVVEVVASALPDGGTRVTATLRHRVFELVAAVVLDVVAMTPFVRAIMHGVELAPLRRNRRAAKVRVLRLALEPLLPHRRLPDQGPFRRG